MDYGKMAYLRLDELEQKLLFGKTEDAKFKNAYAFIEPYRKIEEKNSFFAARISGGGAMSLIVKATLDTEAAGTLAVALNGIPAGRVKIEKTGRLSEIIMNSVQVPDGAELRLIAENGLEAVILSAEIILSGLNARVVRTADAVCMDSRGGTAAVISGADETLWYRFGATGSVLSAPEINIGYGVSCDVCAVTDNEYIAVYTDSAQNIWGLRLNAGGETRRIFLSGGAFFTALAYYSGHIIVAFIDSAGAGYFVCDSQFNSRSERVYFELPEKARSLTFVKDAEYPMLVINGSDKSYIKSAPPPDGEWKSVLKLNVTWTAEEI